MRKTQIIIFIAGLLAGVVADKILSVDPSEEMAKQQLQDQQRSELIERQADERNKQLWGAK